MTFASPWMFLLLLPLLLRLLLAVRDRRRPFSAFEIPIAAARAGSFRSAFSFLPLLLETAAMALVIYALARPQLVTRRADERLGIDIVVALDASGSMAAEDFRPRDRFTVARDLIGRFVQRRTDDRIGVVTFGARAATRVPITYDHDVVVEILKRAKIGENGDGTAIGHAIATSVNRLRNSKSRAKVVILVTDGVNNAGSIEPATAAALASRFGIRIYTIGVGSRGPVPIPMKMQNPVTGDVDTVLRLVRADLDEEMLQGIAASTGGAYFRATDPQALATVFARIDQLEKSRMPGPRVMEVKELYLRPLSLGLLFLAVALLTGETLWMRLPA